MESQECGQIWDYIEFNRNYIWSWNLPRLNSDPDYENGLESLEQIIREQ